MLGQNDASLRPDLPAFERSGARKRRSGPKTLDRQANLGDLGVKRHATWGMSGYTPARLVYLRAPDIRRAGQNYLSGLKHR